MFGVCMFVDFFFWSKLLSGMRGKEYGGGGGGRGQGEFISSGQIRTSGGVRVSLPIFASFQE